MIDERCRKQKGCSCRLWKDKLGENGGLLDAPGHVSPMQTFPAHIVHFTSTCFKDPLLYKGGKLRVSQ